MKPRLPLSALLAGTLVLPLSAVGAAPAPIVQMLKIYNPSSGPGTGTFTAVARISLRGTGADAMRAPDGSLRRLKGTLALRAGNRTIRASDSVRLQPGAETGGTAFLYFRFRIAQSRLLHGARTVVPSMLVGLEGRRMRAAVAPTGTRLDARSHQGPLPGVPTAWCMWMTPIFGPCTTISAQPPSPPVALTGTSGATAGSMCVYFDGPGASGPYVSNEFLAIIGQPMGWTIFVQQGAGGSIGAAGTYSDGSAWAQAPFSPGGVQSPGSTIVTVSGIVTRGALGGSGTATLGYAGPEIGGLAQQMTLSTTGSLTESC